jgi:hypothetical protein
MAALAAKPRSPKNASRTPKGKQVEAGLTPRSLPKKNLPAKPAKETSQPPKSSRGKQSPK